MIKHVFKIAPAASLIGLGALFYEREKKKTLCINLEEFKKHDNKKSCWTSYKNYVYDITNFVNVHPGGNLILKSCGKSLDPFWNSYKIHYNDQVLEILEEYKLGKNSSELDKYLEKSLEKGKNISKIDKKKHEKLNILKKDPLNLEPRLDLLRKDYLTPKNLMYVRNHHEIPNIDDYKLNLNFCNIKKEFTLDEIKSYPKSSIVTTIQCAGNRRKDYFQQEKVLGLKWQGGAIFNAKFEGVLLKDLIGGIYKLNLDTNLDGYYLNLIGYDSPFSASIEIKNNLELLNRALIAYKMNDEELDPVNGYPIRIVLPGYSGAKNIKWLKEINISKEVCDVPWQTGVAYKSFGPEIKSFLDIDDEHKKKIPTVEKLPVQSFICSVEHIKEENLNYLLIKGIAYSGGGSNIIRVDVSVNDKWTSADLLLGSEQKNYEGFAWTFWEKKIEVSEKEFLIKCNATDINYNTQPDDIKKIWNLRGILNNSVHEINFKID